MSSRFFRLARRHAVSIAALILAVVAVAYGLHSCARDDRASAFLERKEPLARALVKHRPMLARAAALQPNFKELTQEVTPSRCREILERSRTAYEVDPYAISARCEGKDVSLRLDPCEGARVFAQAGGAESQHGDRVEVMLQSRKRIEREGVPSLDVVLLLLADDHRVLEMHRLLFPGENMQGKPLSTLVRVVSAKGYYERKDEDKQSEVSAVTTDGTVQLFRRSGKQEGPSQERVRAAGIGWDKAYLLPPIGVFFGSAGGLNCQPPSWSELELTREHDAVECTRIRALDGGDVKVWDRGKGCNRAFD